MENQSPETNGRAERPNAIDPPLYKIFILFYDFKIGGHVQAVGSVKPLRSPQEAIWREIPLMELGGRKSIPGISRTRAALKSPHVPASPRLRQQPEGYADGPQPELLPPAPHHWNFQAHPE